MLAGFFYFALQSAVLHLSFRALSKGWLLLSKRMVPSGSVCSLSTAHGLGLEARPSSVSVSCVTSQLKNNSN